MSSDGDRGERRARGDGQEGSNNASEEWSGDSAEDSEGSETEDEATTLGGAEGERETRTATPWGTQDSGAGELHWEARERYMGKRGPAGATPEKPLSVAANEAGARGRHGARPAQRGQQGGR